MTILDLAAIEADLQRQLDRTRRMPTEPLISVRAETLRGLIAAARQGMCEMTNSFEIADETFLSDVAKEAYAARKKFPGPNPTIAALTEEVGELAQALLHIREGKSTDWSRVHKEAVQVAVMAMRAATEGDATIGAVPTAENCR